MTELAMGGIGVHELDAAAPLPLDHGSFNDWAGPHVPALRALAIREVGTAAADDVVQNTLMRAWQRRSTFDPARGSARAWLVAILLDRSRRFRVRDIRIGTKLASDAPSAARAGERGPDGRIDVEAAVRRLPQRQRQVVVLHYLADLPVREVAGVLGITEGAVKAQLFDARARLRSLLEDRHD